MKKAIGAIVIALSLFGCVPKTITIYKPVPTYIPVADCTQFKDVIQQLKDLVGQDIDLSKVDPKDQIRVLCELAAQNTHTQAALKLLVATLEQNELDCQLDPNHK